MTEEFRYTSLFDSFTEKDCPPLTYNASLGAISYDGSLGEILSDLEAISNSGQTQDPLGKNILHPSRITRAVVDYKIEHPEATELVRESVQLALNIYKRSSCLSDRISRFRERTLEIAGEELLTRRFLQEDDPVTRSGSQPYRSKNLALNLADWLGNQDILFLALGHGGTAAGMDVYLRYLDYTQAKNSTFYVARFSRYKSRDSSPQVNDAEIAYLRSEAAERRVIVFDEDCISGKTLIKAKSFFEKQVLEGQRVIPSSNYVHFGSRYNLPLHVDLKLISTNQTIFEDKKITPLIAGDRFEEKAVVYHLK